MKPLRNMNLSAPLGALKEIPSKNLSRPTTQQNNFQCAIREDHSAVPSAAFGSGIGETDQGSNADGLGSLTTEWLTTKEAANYLRVSVPALRNLTSNGKVPFFKWEGRNRYLLVELRKLLLKNPKGGFHGN
jgi:excisionase family DNA binding protein